MLNSFVAYSGTDQSTCSCISWQKLSIIC